MMVVGTTITLSVTRSLTLSMLGGLVLYVGAIVYTDKLLLYIPILVAICFMLIKHMSNIKESLERRK